MLHTNNLICARDNFVLPQQINISLYAGEVLQVIGANGSGKTTLLRTLSGLLKPRSGKMRLESDGLCYVSSKSNLHPSLTVWQNIIFLQNFIYNTEKGGVEHLADDSISYFALKGKKNTLTSQLSSGELQRLKLTILYLTNARLWLLDEPYVFLDEVGIELTNKLIDKHLKTGGMVIIAGQNLNNAVCLANSKKIAIGSLCAH